MTVLISKAAALDDFVVGRFARISVGAQKARRTMKIANNLPSRFAGLLLSLQRRAATNMKGFTLQDRALCEELRAIAVHQAMIQECSGTYRHSTGGDQIVR